MDAIEQVSCWPPPQSTQGHDTGVYNAMETIRSFFLTKNNLKIYNVVCLISVCFE